MHDAVLKRLLTNLCEGDSGAAEAAFRAYAPYLRTIVRRHLSVGLRRKFDSLDIVQSVWVDVLDGLRGQRWHFKDLARLRAFLVRATHNHLADHQRHQAKAFEHAVPLVERRTRGLPANPEPRPSQVAQAEELWKRMLQLCSPAHRPILELKRQGLTLPEIAARTGLHESTIRRILYELARRLANRDCSAADQVTGASTGSRT